jgi:nucleotide-binding universal stress UspA family protein
VFSKVLIPLDGSELALAALYTLRPLLIGATKPEVTLLRVLGDSEAQAATEELDRARALLEAWGLTTATILEREGDAADRILACAEALGVDLVAMSSHGHSGVTRMVRGSVAERVLRRCTAPLLLCTPQSGGVGDYPAFRQILVPLDGSELAEQILPDVEKIALACESEVTLLRVDGLLAMPPSVGATPRAWDPEHIEKALSPLNPQRDALQQAGVTVGRQVAYGSPADQVLRAAQKTDLIAMTTHGRSGASRWFFGSVAEAVLREAACPLLVRRVLESPAS